MIGKGDNLRHPLYISDMLNAFQLAMTVSKAAGNLYIVAGEKAVTTKELIATFCKICNLKLPTVRIPCTIGKAIAVCIETLFHRLHIEPPVSRRTLEFFDTNNAFDISKIKKDMNFLPQYTLSQGIDDFCRRLGEFS